MQKLANSLLLLLLWQLRQAPVRQVVAAAHVPAVAVGVLLVLVLLLLLP
jgi:hypothetical protein